MVMRFERLKVNQLIKFSHTKFSGKGFYFGTQRSLQSSTFGAGSRNKARDQLL